ncbi:hypothetical protein [Aureivirga sp. CE67]|uniref:hypothetical protein n=1 Tax=Aureivirga sp. CE67 TaxID=1788983 RepID=UPI001E313F48|nr:hypothetical protein [Aureivirga sp. CE67]
MKLKLIIIMMIGFSLVSCDPAQTIEIENNSNDLSTIKFFFTGTEYYKFDNFVTKDSLIINLDSAEARVFDFGIGTWEIHNSLDSLVNRVERIEIVTKKSTELFESKDQVKSFFWDRLIDDRYRARIIIKIE